MLEIDFVNWEARVANSRQPGKNVFVIFISLLFIGCISDPKTEKNIENLEKIKIGMEIKEVYKVMGKPDLSLNLILILDSID